MPRGSTATRAPAVLTPEGLAKAINKKWPGAAMMASDPSLEIQKLPTGILSIDMLLGGGFARNRHVELFGGYNVGKTAITYRYIATTQANGGRCAFIDAEGTFDPRFAAALGVDLATLAFHPQTHGQRVVDFAATLLASKLYDVIVIDSIASLTPKVETETEMDAGSMGTEQAKLMSKALRKLTTANSMTSLVFINQTREAIGVMFGKRSITSGGKAMGFYAGTRLDLVRTENIKHNTKVIDPANNEERTASTVKGHRVLVRVEKDKTGSAYQGDETTMVFDYTIGDFDHMEDLVYWGRKLGYIQKNTVSWWVDGYEEDKFDTRNKFKSWLKRNGIVAEELEENIRSHMYEAA